MRGASRIACLWPGLLRLWYAGEFSSLLEAFAFAALLNLAILATFFRPDAVSLVWRAGIWATVGLFWLYGLWQGFRSAAPDEPADSAPDQQDLFIRAQSEYLRGHWVEAQTLVEQLIELNPEDIEARLLLAAVFRRTRRIDLSRFQLRQAQDLAGAARWRFEIGQELAALDRSVTVAT